MAQNNSGRGKGSETLEARQDLRRRQETSLPQLRVQAGGYFGQMELAGPEGKARAPARLPPVHSPDVWEEAAHGSRCLLGSGRW